MIAFLVWTTLAMALEVVGLRLVQRPGYGWAFGTGLVLFALGAGAWVGAVVTYLLGGPRA